MSVGVPASRLPPLGPAPQVAVVVPVRNGADDLGATVAAALQPDVTELVMAVGPSTDGTEAVAAALAERHPIVRVVPNPSGRTPDALNRAVAATRAQVIVRVDAHARLPAGYVARAVETLRSTGAANVGGRQVPVAHAGQARAIAAAMRSPVGAGGAAYRTSRRPGPADTVYLGVFRREALDEVGGFDPRFVRNQDAELNLRLRRAGHQVWFDPGLAVAYRPRSTLRALARQYRQYGQWRRLTARTHRGSLAARQLAPPVLLAGLTGTAAASLLARDPRPAAGAFGGYLGILAGAGLAASPTDALATAAALGTMHLAWAVGFLQGPPDLPEDVPDVRS